MVGHHHNPSVSLAVNSSHLITRIRYPILSNLCCTYRYVIDWWYLEFRSISSTSLICLDSLGRMGDGPLTKKCVTDYLKANRAFLEQHVLEHVDADTLERWYIRRVQREKNTKPQSNRKRSEDRSNRKISISRWKVSVSNVIIIIDTIWNVSSWQFCLHADKRHMLETLMNSLATHPQPGRILWELSCCVASAVGADGFVLHLANPQSNMLHVFRRYLSCLICFYRLNLTTRIKSG